MVSTGVVSRILDPIELDLVSMCPGERQEGAELPIQDRLLYLGDDWDRVGCVEVDSQNLAVAVLCLVDLALTVRLR